MQNDHLMPKEEGENNKEVEESVEVEIIPDDEAEDSPAGVIRKLEKCKSVLEKCGLERKEYLEGWQRAKADFINYKKDEGKRLEDLAKFVTSNFAQDLLIVLDSFELALRSFQLPASSVRQQDEERGVLLIKTQLLDILKKRGIEEILVSPGGEFNPERHESIGEVESENAAGTIAEIVQRGYIFQGRVLRPARVKIAK